MNTLEKNIVKNARIELQQLKYYSGIDGEYDPALFNKAWDFINAYVMLSLVVDTGMSAEARAALGNIEKQAAQVMTDSNKIRRHTLEETQAELREAVSYAELKGATLLDGVPIDIIREFLKLKEVGQGAA